MITKTFNLIKSCHDQTELLQLQELGIAVDYTVEVLNTGYAGYVVYLAGHTTIKLITTNEQQETWLWLKYSPNELFLESWIEND